MGRQKALSKGEPQYFSHSGEVAVAAVWEEAVARQGGSRESGGSYGSALGRTTVPQVCRAAEEAERNGGLWDRFWERGKWDSLMARVQERK